MYRWSEEKNRLLISQRGISFNDVLYELENNGVIDNYKHPNEDKYPNQYIYVIRLKGVYSLCTLCAWGGLYIFKEHYSK